MTTADSVVIKPPYFYLCSLCMEYIPEAEQPLDADGRHEDRCTKCGKVGFMCGYAGERALYTAIAWGHAAGERVEARDLRRMGIRAALTDEERRRMERVS